MFKLSIDVVKRFPKKYQTFSSRGNCAGKIYGLIKLFPGLEERSVNRDEVLERHKLQKQEPMN